MRGKTRKITIFSMLLIVLAVLSWAISPTWTPPIPGHNSISVLEQIEVNGAEHTVMIRGVDRSNPVIVFVHGGPGCSEIPYVRKYQHELEQYFTIVHYDQRGSGKSYRFFEDYANVTTDQLTEDLLALTDYVAELLGQEKVLLIGHSFGTYIGMKAAAAAPGKYHAYIGIGQVADTVQSELDSWAFTMEQASLAGQAGDIDQLRSIQPAIAAGEAITPRHLVRKYGGAARLIDDNRDYMLGFLFSPEYNGLDVIRYVRGVAATQGRLMKEEAAQPLTSLVTSLDVPVYVVMGEYDYMTSVNAAKEYFDALKAPYKQFLIFEESAHYPQFEEKERFAAWLKEEFKHLL